MISARSTREAIMGNRTATCVFVATPRVLAMMDIADVSQNFVFANIQPLFQVLVMKGFSLITFSKMPRSVDGVLTKNFSMYGMISPPDKIEVTPESDKRGYGDHDFIVLSSDDPSGPSIGFAVRCRKCKWTTRAHARIGRIRKMPAKWIENIQMAAFRQFKEEVPISCEEAIKLSIIYRIMES